MDELQRRVELFVGRVQENTSLDSKTYRFFVEIAEMALVAFPDVSVSGQPSYDYRHMAKELRRELALNDGR